MPENKNSEEDEETVKASKPNDLSDQENVVQLVQKSEEDEETIAL